MISVEQTYYSELLRACSLPPPRDSFVKKDEPLVPDLFHVQKPEDQVVMKKLDPLYHDTNLLNLHPVQLKMQEIVASPGGFEPPYSP